MTIQHDKTFDSHQNNSLSSFQNSMPPAPWQCTQNGRVIESDFWPQLGSGEETGDLELFEQACYLILFNHCLRHFPRDGNNRVIPQAGGSVVYIYGTPGIGKSCFLDYALKQLLDDGYTVLYLHGQRQQAYVFRPSDAPANAPAGSTNATMETRDLMPALKDNVARNVDVILFDPNEDSSKTNEIEKTHLCGKPTIVGLAPDKDNCKKLRKDLPKKDLYMGTMDRAEAEQMRTACFPTITQQLMNRRFSAGGGIPRYLFKALIVGDTDDSDSELAEITSKQTSALNIMLQNPLLIDAGEVAKDFKSLWSVFHLQPQITATNGVNHYQYTIEPCCDDFRAKIRDHLMQLEVSQLWLTYSNTLVRHGTLRGIRYEAYAHKKIRTDGLPGRAASLMGGGSRSMQVQIPAGVRLISLPNNDLRVGSPFWNAIQEARETTNGAYILPETSNFPVIDSLYQSPGTRGKKYNLQMKAGRSKPLARTSAQAIYTATGAHLVFVVPDESVMNNRLGYTGPGGNPQGLKQYRIVLAEP